ncbi:hypothetical protein [Xanthobacter aminoxidans]|jgi:hypothetical protein|uniref:Uncharacterized protein n=1 Tax=Xanthobacter aminoxidans TaxID=186280 RepID=A0ABW6ZBE4_9HYPH
MNALELTAFGLFGIVLTFAANGLTAQKPYMTVAGGPGIPIEDVLLQTPEPRFARVAPSTDTKGAVSNLVMVHAGPFTAVPRGN